MNGMNADEATYLVVELKGGFVAKKKPRVSTYRAEVESLADSQRAIRVVRSRARERGIDPARVGIMGLSAGGFAATELTILPSG